MQSFAKTIVDAVQVKLIVCLKNLVNRNGGIVLFSSEKLQNFLNNRRLVGNDVLQVPLVYVLNSLI